MVFGLPRTEPGAVQPPRFDYGTSDGYDFYLRMGAMPNADTRFMKGRVAFWKEMMAHETYDDFWKARNLRPHLRNIKPAVMTVGGWFDAENLYGALNVYRSRAAEPGRDQHARDGAVFHGGWSRADGDSLGDVTFGSKTSVFYREKIEAPFFNHYLKGQGSSAGLPEAYVFETGTNVGAARHLAAEGCGAPGAVLHAGGRLSFDAARTGRRPSTST